MIDFLENKKNSLKLVFLKNQQSYLIVLLRVKSKYTQILL